MNWKSTFATIRKLSRFFWLAWAAFIINWSLHIKDPNFPTAKSKIPLVIIFVLIFVYLPWRISVRVRDYIALGNLRFRVPFTIVLFSLTVGYLISITRFLVLFIRKSREFNASTQSRNVDPIQWIFNELIHLLKTSPEGKMLIWFVFGGIVVRISRFMLFRRLDIEWSIKAFRKARIAERKSQKINKKSTPIIIDEEPKS